MSEMKSIPSGLYAFLSKRPSFQRQTKYTAYEYKDMDGKLLGAVGRIEYDIDGKREKDFVQVSWDQGKKRWLPKATNITGNLFQQDMFGGATLFVFVEGEKAAVRLQAHLPPGIVATTLAGGASMFGGGNFSPLRDRDVVIWRDNDAPGQKGAMRAHSAMVSAGVNVKGWVKIDKSWQEKWDCVDVIDKLGAEVAISALSNLENYTPDATATPMAEVSTQTPFEILGRSDNDDVYFYCFQDGSVRMINQKMFDDMQMLQIYNNLNFWEEFCGINERTGKPDKVRGWMNIWGKVLARGVYEPAQSRYAGLYKDHMPDGTPCYVANCGTFLYINGEKVAHADFCHNYFYIQDRSTGINPDCFPMGDEEAKQVTAFFEMLQLEGLGQRQLALGWCIASFLSGCLPRRPHLWLFAPALSGKSYILERMHLLLGGSAFTMTASASSYAGVKQHVGSRCYPVLWDESEAQKQNQEDKWEKVMEMARVSFDAQDGKILQGTKDGSGAFVTPRMMFCFSSIKTADMDESVSSRIVKLYLSKFKKEGNKAQHIRDCNAANKAINWEDISSRLFLRVYANADCFFANLSTAQKLFEDMGADNRRASSLAICFAGYLLMYRTSILTESEMLGVIWTDPHGMMPISDKEEENLYDYMVAAVAEVQGDTTRARVSVNDVRLAMKSGLTSIPGTMVTVQQALRAFEQEGFGIDRHEVFVWPKNKRIYKAMGWYKGIDSVAPSLPGYRSGKYSLCGNEVQGFFFSVDKSKNDV